MWRETIQQHHTKKMVENIFIETVDCVCARNANFKNIQIPSSNICFYFFSFLFCALRLHWIELLIWKKKKKTSQSGDNFMQLNLVLPKCECECECEWAHKQRITSSNTFWISWNARTRNLTFFFFCLRHDTQCECGGLCILIIQNK